MTGFPDKTVLAKKKQIDTMAINPKPTFVLVPGSFSVIESYDKLTPVITKAGYEYKLVPLLSANDGTRFPAPTMQDDAAQIRKNVQEVLDKGSDVVLVLHSYSGVPGSEALSGLGHSDRPEGSAAVTGIVYIAAIVPVVGQSLLDLMFSYLPDDMKADNPGGYIKPNPEMYPFVFSDLTDPDEVEKYTNMMVRHTADSYRGVLGYAAWKDIPSIYISTGKDVVVPPELQNAMVEKAQKESGKMTKVLNEQSGHCPIISFPEWTTEQLIKATKL